jgi:hypothetical protein
MPKIALDEVWTTLPTPASRAASRMLAVPTTFTDRNSALSRASGTWATLLKTTSTPSNALRSASRSRTSPARYSTSFPRGGLRSKTRTWSPRASARSATTSPK